MMKIPLVFKTTNEQQNKASRRLHLHLRWNMPKRVAEFIKHQRCPSILRLIRVPSPAFRAPSSSPIHE